MRKISLGGLLSHFRHDSVQTTASHLPVLSIPTSQQPFDLNKLQGEPARRGKRKRLLRWSLPCAVIVGAAALWFLLPATLTRQAIRDYGHQKYQSSRHWLTPLTWTSPQPFVIAFNSGTVDTQLGKYTLAQTELTRALVLAPEDKRCMVLQNLVFSITAHAENLTSQGRASEATTYTIQAANYKRNSKKCFPAVPTTENPDTPGGGGGGGGGGGAQEQSQQILSPAQQQQLQQKNQQGQQSQQQDYQQNNVNANNPNIKPW